jgi:MFS family permease
LANRLADRIGLGRLVAISAVAFPGAIAIAALAAGPLWSRAVLLGCAEFVGGFAVMCFDIPLNSMKATVIPDRVRSRVAGAFSTVNYGIRPVGAVVGGFLGSAIGVRDTLLISAAGGALSVLWLIGSGILQVRQLVDLEPIEDPSAHNMPAGGKRTRIRSSSGPSNGWDS